MLTNYWRKTEAKRDLSLMMKGTSRMTKRMSKKTMYQNIHQLSFHRSQDWMEWDRIIQVKSIMVRISLVSTWVMKTHRTKISSIPNKWNNFWARRKWHLNSFHTNTPSLNLSAPKSTKKIVKLLPIAKVKDNQYQQMKDFIWIFKEWSWKGSNSW